jgi:hypothetical protein
MCSKNKGITLITGRYSDSKFLKYEYYLLIINKNK